MAGNGEVKAVLGEVPATAVPLAAPDRLYVVDARALVEALCVDDHDADDSDADRAEPWYHRHYHAIMLVAMIVEIAMIGMLVVLDWMRR